MKKSAAVFLLLMSVPGFVFARASKIQDNMKMADMEWAETFGGPAQAGTEIIRDSESWKNLWSRLGQPNPPAADFSKVMGVAVFMGSKPTGGYSARVEKVEKKKKQLLIYVRETAPNGGFVIQAFTSPYCVKLIERSELPVVFKKIKN